MTQLEAARNGKISQEVAAVAKEEQMDAELLRQKVALGEVVILKNRNHSIDKPVGVGNGLRTKINANLGTSTDHTDIDDELQKA